MIDLAETTLHITRAADDYSALLTRYTGGYDYLIEKSGLNDDRSSENSRRLASIRG